MATNKDDKDLLARLKKRFAAVESEESDFRIRYQDDMEFLFADSDNQDQWPAQVKADRARDKKPMITINKVHTHWLHVVNQSKENKPTIKIHPTNDEATYEAAQIFEGIVRHIEYASDAQTAYDIAMETSTGGGIGYWRIKTMYCDDQSFDQDIRICEISDPMTVYFGPHKKRDGSDVMYAFIYEDMPNDMFEAAFPNAPKALSNARSTKTDGWMTKQTTRVCEYFEIEQSKEWMYAEQGPDGRVRYTRQSDMPPEEQKLMNLAIEQSPETHRRRRVDKRVVKWYKVAGDTVIDRGIWPGKYIPIIRVPGEEVVKKTGNSVDRKGLVRYLKDAQRAYNYNASGQLEFGALQTKTPWMAGASAIRGYETYYADANTTNFSYLPYNDMDDAGNPIAPPHRLDPPMGATAFGQGMMDAERQLMMASGQYEATFSEQGNEISGVAIDKRQTQGNRVTFHYIDSLAKAIRFTGKQIIDLVPKIYDTQRIVRILGADGDEQQIQIDPVAEQALAQREDSEEAKVQTIFNPNVGAFDVVAEVGPNFETRRQEAFNAMKDLLGADPNLTQVIGDLWMQSADFPNADKLAERMRNWIPATIRDGGPSQEEQALQQQVQQMQGVIAQLQQALSDKSQQLQIEKQRTDMDYVNHLALRMDNEVDSRIDAFKAETDRLKVVAPAMTPLAIEEIVRKMIMEMQQAPNPSQDIDPPQYDAPMALQLAAPEITAPLAPLNPQPQQGQPQGQPQPQGTPNG